MTAEGTHCGMKIHHRVCLYVLLAAFCRALGHIQAKEYMEMHATPNLSPSSPWNV